MYPNPRYVDGRQAVVDLSVYCYNNGATYLCPGGDPSNEAPQTELKDTDNRNIGSVTYGSLRKGTLNLQYKLALDEQPGAANLLLPTFIVSFRQRFYVCGEPKTTIVKNDVIKISVPVIELAAPFVPTMLSVLGQQLAESRAASGGFTKSAAASGTRTGATVAYTLETYATEGSSPPTGFAINSSTGLITYTPTQPTGYYDMRIVVADTVTLADGTTDTIYGQARYTVRLT